MMIAMKLARFWTKAAFGRPIAYIASAVEPAYMVHGCTDAEESSWTAAWRLPPPHARD